MTRGTHWTEWWGLTQRPHARGFLVLRLVRDGRYVETVIPGSALARWPEPRRRRYIARCWRELRAELRGYARFRARVLAC